MQYEFVNGIEVSGVYGKNDTANNVLEYVNTYEELLDQSDAIYIVSKPQHHYEQIHTALMHGKHVLCESPVTLKLSGSHLQILILFFYPQFEYLY